jgi:hypothetical protein
VTKALEILDRRFRETFSLASNQLVRHRVTVTSGQYKGGTGWVTSMFVGSRGEIIARVSMDHHYGKGLKGRLQLPLGMILVGERMEV